MRPVSDSPKVDGVFVIIYVNLIQTGFSTIETPSGFVFFGPRDQLLAILTYLINYGSIVNELQ